MARYVERNALRAGLVKRALDWRWSNIWRREHGTPEERGIFSAWPVQRPPDWMARVNRAQLPAEEAALRLGLNYPLLFLRPENEG